MQSASCQTAGRLALAADAGITPFESARSAAHGVDPEPNAREKAGPVLDLLASTLSVIGDKAGDGQAFKTVNQLLCGVHIAVAAEALALMEALGLNMESTLATLSAGAAGSFMLANRGPRMLDAYSEDGAEVPSCLDIFVKDMGIVTTAARSFSLATPVAAAAEQIYLLGQASGLAAHDDSAVIRVIAPQITDEGTPDPRSAPPAFSMLTRCGSSSGRPSVEMRVRCEDAVPDSSRRPR